MHAVSQVSASRLRLCVDEAPIAWRPQLNPFLPAPFLPVLPNTITVQGSLLSVSSHVGKGLGLYTILPSPIL